MTAAIAQDHEREKKTAARNSVVAAIGLTAMKLAVGLATGSLGILAEAAHSGLDLVAAVVTLLAVRISDRPADRQHTYGHGKVENLSALAETLLLLLTCVWIVWEAVHRLFFEDVAIEVTWFAFAVMAISIAVDVSRSRMLYRVAQKHNSQALEADALHFSTDIWSSAVVILGLFCVKIGDWYPSLSILREADAAAAIVVALIVVWVSIRLGMRSIQALLDAAPSGLREAIAAAIRDVPGVRNYHRLRVRSVGPQPFVDVHLLADGQLTLSEAHRLTEDVEAAVRKVAPHCDVTVHAEPTGEGNDDTDLPE